MSRSRRVAVAVVVALAASGASLVFGASGRFDDGAQVARPALRLDAPTVPGATPEQRAAHDLVGIINSDRANRGLPPYQWHDLVAAAAIAHSQEMAANRILRHQGNDGSNAGIRLERAGLVWGAWGENLGAGQIEPRPLFDAWMNSVPHRPQLIGDYRYIGVGTAIADDGTPYWTMVVAS